MEVIRFDDPVLFQEQSLDYLVNREAENNLMLGVLANVVSGDYSTADNYLALFREGAAICAAVLCTPPWPVILSYENPPPDQNLLKMILKDLEDRLQDDLTGLSGNKNFVSPLVEIWEQGSGREAMLKMAMRIYKLEKVIRGEFSPGRLRRTTSRDTPLLLDWYTAFHREANGENPDQDYVQETVEAYLNSASVRRGMMVWEVEGEPVSMAGYGGPTPHGIRVGAVYTPPEHRKNGYASAVTAELSQFVLDLGYKFSFLFTDLGNPTSNHIYQNIGYQPVCDVDRYLFV